MTAPAALITLRAALRTYVAAHAPDITAFCGPALATDHAYLALDPRDLPAATLLHKVAAHTTPALHPVVAAIRAAAPQVTWRHSYKAEDDGISADFLNRSGWFNLIAPSGPFVSDTLRLSIGFWDQGLHYPRHWHTPAEIYLTLAGSADYISEGRAPITGGPGARIHHTPNQPHAADMAHAPLLAAAFWTGEGLEAPSTLARRAAPQATSHP